MKACFASNGFNGKIDCDEWAKDTNYKSLPNKKESGGYNMYRPKNCKKCGRMQAGGPAPVPLPNQKSPFTTLEQANAFAKDFALRRGLVSGENTYVDQLPTFLDPQGRPVTENPSVPTNNFVPSDVSELQWNSELNLPYYTDSRTGDLVYTSQQNFYSPRFQKNKGMSAEQLGSANRATTPVAPGTTAMRMKGGRIQRMQMGGMPRQQDFPDYESYAAALDAWHASNAQQMVPQQQGMNMLQNFTQPVQDFDSPTPELAQKPLNAVQDGIRKGLIESPQNYDGSAQQWYVSSQQKSSNWQPSQKNNANPYQTMQNIGLGMQAARTGLGWISGAIERGRQNKFDMQQQTALGQMNPMQVDDFQPNPYNLYMEKGGNLKTIMKDYNMWSNDAGPMDMTHGQGNPELKKGGYEIDRMIIVRKLLPELLNFGHLGSNYRKYRGQQGGLSPNYHFNPYFSQPVPSSRDSAEYKYAFDGLMSGEAYHRKNMEDAKTALYALPDVSPAMLQFHGNEEAGYEDAKKQMLEKYRNLRGTLPFLPQLKKGGIHIKKENEGKFTDYCGGKVTDECIEKGLNSPSATTRKRANFARNARKWNH